MMPETTAIIVRDDARLQVTFTESATAMRNNALAVSALIGKVSSAEDQQKAVEAQKELYRIHQLVEKARKACKDPVLQYGRRIDDAAKNFCNELGAELARIAGLIGSFQQLELMKARAAEKAQREELDKIEREKAAALAKVKSHEEADAIQEHFSNRAAVEAAPITEPARVEGQRIGHDWEITVINPYELSKYHPSCVTISPKLGEIKQLLNEGVTVRGITAKRVVKAGIRLGASARPIDV